MRTETNTKEQLYEILESQLILLRQMLDNLSKEYQAILEESQLDLESVIDQRFTLMATFSEKDEQFQHYLKELLNAEIPFSSFVDALGMLQQNLNIDDVDLHLICEQVHCLVSALRDETMRVLHLLQTPSLRQTTIRMPLEKLQPTGFQTVVGVLDPDQETLS